MQMSPAGRPAGCISALDRERLEALIERIFSTDKVLNPAASAVLHRLRNAATIAQPEQIPPGLVTMNSTVRLVDDASGRDWEVTLVYPEDHDPSESCWSVLNPVGAAIFSRCIGDIAEIAGEDGVVTSWRIDSIPFQPEARSFLTM